MKSNDLSSYLMCRIKALFIGGIVVLYPFVNLIDTYLTFKFLGEALFNFLIFLSILIFVFPRVIKFRYGISEFSNHVFIFILSLAVMLIYMFNNQYDRPLSMAAIIAQNRFVFMPYLVFILFTGVINSYAFLVKFSKFVVLSGVITAVFRIINYYVFPGFQIVSYHIINNGLITRDLLQGSSMTANVILTSMFMLVCAYEKSIIKIAGLVYFSYVSLMFLAILTTGSRYPQFIGLLVFLYGYRLLPQAPKLIFLLVSMMLFFGVYLHFFNGAHVILRSLNDSGGRFDKLVLSLSIICTSLKSFFFGTPGNLIALERTASGLQVSDNSYMLLAMSWGVPLSLTWFIYMGTLFRRFITSGFILFYALYVIVGLLLTNCILWDAWVFFVILVLFCMALMNNYNAKEGAHERVS